MGKETPAWTKENVLHTSGGYWSSFVLHSAVKLDIFSSLGQEQLTVEEIANKIGSDIRGTGMLLNALTAMGLLRKQDRRYANTQAAMEYLSKDSPHYLGYIIQHHAHLVESWARLHESVRQGKPVRKQEITPEERNSFLMGMYNLAMGIAPSLAQQMDLKGRTHLLDLGGGPGTYAVQFCLANPELRATIFDLPTTEPFALSLIQKFGLSDRIQFIAGDYSKDDLPSGYDVAWLSHIFHAEGPQMCRTILEKTVAGLRPEGLLFIHDFILNDDKASPLFPALFALNMLVNTVDGRSYSEPEIREMLEQTGISKIQRFPFTGPNQSGILYGVKASG